MCDFASSDPRHLEVKENQTFSSFMQRDADWACGFVEDNPAKFGFVPLKYLSFQKDTRSGPPAESNL